LNEKRAKFYLVGTMPVKVTLRSIQGRFLPVSAEIRDRRTGTMKIDNTYLTMISEGEEVREITGDEFAALVPTLD